MINGREFRAKYQINDTGELPAFAWPGGYPIAYIAADSETICPDCANSEECKTAEPDDRQWLIVACDINYDDRYCFCANCNERIESAYAEDDE